MISFKILKIDKIHLFLLTILLFKVTGCQPQPPHNSGAENSPELIHQPGQGKTIRVSLSSLKEEHFQTEIVNLGLEQLGYEIIPMKNMTYITIHLALSNGDLDYTTMYWDKSHLPFFQEAGGETKLKRVGVLTSNLINGYQIDKKTAQAYNITTIDQLSDPKLAQLFDTDGDNKANLIGCNPGWSCGKVINHHLKTYGLENTVEQDQSNYNTLIKQTLNRYREGKPILYYTWTPLWMAAILTPYEEVVWLGVPYTSFPENYKNVTDEDTTVGNLNLGFAIDRMRIVANKTFLEANPAAEKLFELVKIPVDDINVQNQRIQDGEDSPEKIRAHAKEWVINHQEQFDHWVEEARKVDL